MAQGYLGSDSGNGAAELKGRENLRNLAMRCLFQDIEKSESGEQIEWCKLHDIVHDFALSLRKNDDKERSCQVCDSSLVSHVQPFVGIHLRWLDIRLITLSKDDLEIICRLYFLQSLLLLWCELTEIPQQIWSLNQLRRLDLSWNRELKELSESMGSLVELRTLSLESCSLKVICRGIGNLVQLRQLDLSRNRELKELPESMGSLVELQTLKIERTDINYLPQALGELSNLHTLELCPFKVGSQYNKLGLLKKLYRRLIVSLHLKIYLSSMSEKVDLVEDARQAQLKTLLQELETLEISFESEMNEMEQSSIWMEVVGGLVPHYKLKELAIYGYEGSRLPHWMSSPLNFIKQIRLGILSEVSSSAPNGRSGRT
ncbi:hypothetical protein SASPL_139497 [Salvia splendens]|uniref:Disease resistance protein RPM1 n=1 Tax=Salvia splendens TaxID=180675 RepID=A0A8X8WN90_SALSN|nr:hypothetical protein SASPL_139497 [Salvia splendens]